MPILKIDSGKSSSKVGHYLHFDRGGYERTEAFSSNMAARNVKEAEAEFRGVRDAFVQKGGTEFHQAYISFHRSDLGSLEAPDGTPDWNRIADYGHEWAKRAGITERHQVYVVAHGDKPHPHIHVVWNATSFEDGRKYHIHGATELDRLRDINDQLAREHGIQRVLDRTRDAERAPNQVIRRAENGGSRYSWKMDLQARIRAAASDALGERQFRERLKERGVTLKIRGGEYGYEFKDDLDKNRFARGSRLGEEYKAKPLKERFELHDKMARQPGGAAPFAERAQREKEAFDSWRRELREGINGAKRRAYDMPSFERALQNKGIHVTRDTTTGDWTYRYTPEGGIPRQIAARDLGRVYGPESVTPRFEENGFRRYAVSEIGKAVRRSGSEEELRARLAEKGIELDRSQGRLVYQIQHGDTTRSVEGEQLGRAYRTERVEERFAENLDRRDLHGLALEARRESTDRQDYIHRLDQLGAKYNKDDQGRGQLTFRGHTYETGALGKADPDRLLPDGHWQREREAAGVNPWSLAAREAAGLTKLLTQEISRASHEGYHEENAPRRHRVRRRKRESGMESPETWDESF